MLSIGRLSRAAGVKVPTIRYYESIGLIPQPARSEGNQRSYEPGMVERLAFIRHARELGFPLDAIRDLLSLSDQPERPCAAADAIARAQYLAVERRIERLNALKSELARMIEECEGGKVAQCRVIEAVGDHSLCRTEHGAPSPVGEGAPAGSLASEAR